MLKIYKSYESGGLQERSLKDIEKGSWINIINPTPYELKVISELTKVELDFLRSALDDEERSRTDVEDNAIMILTNVPVMRSPDSYDTLPLAIILTAEYIITVCLEETPVLANLNTTRNSSAPSKKPDSSSRFSISPPPFTFGTCGKSAACPTKLSTCSAIPCATKTSCASWSCKKVSLILTLRCEATEPCWIN